MSIIRIPCQLHYRLVWVYCDTVDLALANRRNHRDTSFSYWKIIRGKVCVAGAFGGVELGSGSQIFLAPGMWRDQYFSEDARILSIRFHSENSSLIRFAEPGFHWFKNLHIANFDRASNALLKVWMQIAGNASTDSSPEAALMLQQRFLQWLNEWYKLCKSFIEPHPPESPGEPRIIAMLDVLNRQTGLVPDYDELSRASQLSRSQIDRLFKASGHGSPHQICGQSTLRKAENLLLSSFKPIKEIAVDLGFYDASHFTRWFKSQTGATPKEFRTRPI